MTLQFEGLPNTEDSFLFSKMTLIYRVVEKSGGHTGHPRLQSCINMEGGHFEYLKQKSIYVIVK
jgi:hypothetical protein